MTAPLAQLRVVEFAGLGPAPFCAMVLADMGAEVIRVQAPGPSRNGFAIDGRFDLMNRGRTVIEADLKDPAAREQVLEIVEQSDILIEGYRPGVMERLGLGPEDLLPLHPGLVYGRMTGYGQEGPLAGEVGHDINYLALGGVLGLLGPAGAPPSPPLNLVGDFGGGGMLLALGVLAASINARATGEGQVVDAAMIDGASLLATSIHGLAAAGVWSEERGANALDGGAPWYAAYETADGRHVAVGALEDRFFAAFVAGAELPEEFLQLREDPRHWPSMREAIAQRLRERTQAGWVEVFAGTDACVTPVLDLDEAAAHPHAVARASFVTLEGIRQPRPAPRFSRPGTPWPAAQDSEPGVSPTGGTGG